MRTAPVVEVENVAVVVDAAAHAMTGIPAACPSKCYELTYMRQVLIDTVTMRSKVTCHGAQTLAMPS